MKFNSNEEIQHTVFAHKLVSDELTEDKTTRPAVVALGVVIVQLRILVAEIIKAEAMAEVAATKLKPYTRILPTVHGDNLPDVGLGSPPV